MKTKSFSVIILAMLVALLSVSCSQDAVYTGDGGDEQPEANSLLTIRTRAGEDDGAKVSYPVNVYIFNTSGACVEMRSIASESEQLSLKLPEGVYDVYAIAGATADNYDIPTADAAATDAVISLKSGMTHGDLMSSRNTLKLQEDDVNTLTLSLSRKVMLLESVVMNDIPESVTAVSVTFSPLYENLLLNGGYSGEHGTQTIALSKDANGGVWSNTDETYLLEAINPATITVSLTREGGKSSSYSYTTADELKANYKINISGTYKSSEIQLNGTIEGATWAGTKEIVFDFGRTESSGDTGTDTPSDGVTGTAPEVGTMYEGCYVLKSEAVSGGTAVTLVSARHLQSLSFTEGNQAEIKAAVDSGIAELSVAGISGWRLPTVDELKYVKDNEDDIDAYMKEIPAGTVSYFNTSGKSFYTTDSSGDITTYAPGSGLLLAPVSGDKSCRLRIFATLIFTE